MQKMTWVDSKAFFKIKDLKKQMLLSYNCTVAKKIIEYVMILEINSQTVRKQYALSSEHIISCVIFFIFKIGLFWESATWLSKGYLCDMSVFFLVSSTIFF